MHPDRDHFSTVAAGYAAYRPTYPPALFTALAAVVPQTDAAWDCGAGTGQASVALATHFSQVFATDASAEQIARAVPHARVTYRVALAEESGLPDGSVSLVTVAQALHWFDVPAFHREVRRVLVPGGVIAEWSYGLLDVPDAPAVGDVVRALEAHLKPWWPPERAHVDAAYADLEFPFAPIDIGRFAMEATWTASQLTGYIATWSAVGRYAAAQRDNPLESLARDLARAWGSAETHRIQWPLTLRVGRV
jgi:ubiquinone/menaquinone biosynthesis C-methylase UbiE